VSPTASSHRHEITFTPTPGPRAPTTAVPKDRGRRERKAPPSIVPAPPNVSVPDPHDHQDRRRREPSVAPTLPPGLSNPDRTWHEREVTPLYPPYDSSLRYDNVSQHAHYQHEVEVESSPPPYYNASDSSKVARGPYENDAASLSQLGLPSLEYTFGPPPPQPLAKRIRSALAGFVDSVNAPRREQLERQRMVRDYYRRR
jgi:hypothetical protein